jgi:hypothetical protein
MQKKEPVQDGLVSFAGEPGGTVHLRAATSGKSGGVFAVTRGGCGRAHPSGWGRASSLCSRNRSGLVERDAMRSQKVTFQVTCDSAFNFFALCITVTTATTSLSLNKTAAQTAALVDRPRLIGR